MRGDAFTRSRLYLKKLELPPASILEHLARCFPAVAKEVWLRRLAANRVTLADGTPVSENMPYRHGFTVFYNKEVLDEPPPKEPAEVLYQNADILVVDKPHGVPVTPSGAYVERSLLVQMRRATANPALTPVHRLDRDTAGLVFFSVNPATRGAYQALFQQRAIEREYLALALIGKDSPRQNLWQVETRIVAGDPWYRQAIVPGSANARTCIELHGIAGSFGLFRLLPDTGKKHQLRLHMRHIGFPVLGDVLYSTKHDLPLQLLSRTLAFVDPLTGHLMRFQSHRKLEVGT